MHQNISKIQLGFSFPMTSPWKKKCILSKAGLRLRHVLQEYPRFPLSCRPGCSINWEASSLSVREWNSASLSAGEAVKKDVRMKDGWRETKRKGGKRSIIYPFWKKVPIGVKLPPKTQKPYSRVIAAGRAAGHEDWWAPFCIQRRYWGRLSVPLSHAHSRLCSITLMVKRLRGGKTIGRGDGQRARHSEKSRSKVSPYLVSWSLRFF